MKTYRFLFLLMTTASLSAAASNVYAQTVPTTADPVKAADRFQTDPFAKPSKDPFTVEKDTKAKIPSSNETFVLGGISIRGMSVYKEEQFADIYKNLIGTPITVDQAKAIASEISRRYQNDGYALAVAYVPTQKVDDGSTLTIQVDEGFIGEVSFQGDAPPDTLVNLLNRHVENMRKERPVRSDTLEHYLLLINDIPGNTARAMLKPSPKTPGATDMVIYYVHKDFDALVTTDNRGSRYLGPWQHSVVLSANSALGLDERLTVRTITSSPTKELRYVDLQYDQPINTNGTQVSTMISTVKTAPGETLKTANVKSDSTNIQAKLIHPLLRSRLKNLNVRTAFDLRNSTTDIAGANFTDDRVRSFRVGGSFDIANESSATIIDMEISQGVDGLGSTKDGVGRSSARADHDYTKVTMDVSRNQVLDDNISLLTTASGQYAFSPLLSSEQFQLGGPVYGTAYDPGELVGDHGVAGKLELRYNDDLAGPLVSSYQLYSFYDIGAVWRKNLPVTFKKANSLSSTGAGVRIHLGEYISTNLEVAVPLTRKIQAAPETGSRIFAGMSARY